jgi:hypothetical protein
MKKHDTILVEVSKLDDLTECLLVIRDTFDANGHLDITISVHGGEPKQRSLPQNASLHKYCDNLAKMMNDAGYDQKQLVGQFKDGFSLPVTMEMIKAIFRAVGEAMYKKESTKDLTTVEIQEVYRVVDNRFAEITGCRCEWPSVESLRNKS